MNDTQKLSILKSLMPGIELPEVELSAYLTVARDEILNWIYRLYDDIPEDVKDVPRKYEMIQIQAVIVGFNLQGAENQTTHNENGINRTFKYADMLEYIHANVISLAKVGG